MISKVGTVSVFVSDQQRARDFYVNILEFELRMDAELYPGAEARWIAVAPAGAETELVLYLPDENWAHYRDVVGKPQPITLEVTDIHRLYQDLKGKGVEFYGEPDEQPWGTYVSMKDSEGNSLLLVQQPSGS